MEVQTRWAYHIIPTAGQIALYPTLTITPALQYEEKFLRDRFFATFQSFGGKVDPPYHRHNSLTNNLL